MTSINADKVLNENLGKFFAEVQKGYLTLRTEDPERPKRQPQQHTHHSFINGRSTECYSIGNYE